MWPLFTLCAFAMVTGYVLVSEQVRDAAVASAPAAAALAANMGTYRSAVVDYVQGHPGAVENASVDMGVLNFPAWYSPLGPWRNVVVGTGTVVVYSQAVDAVGLAEQLASLSDGSVLAGLALPTAAPSSELTLHTPGGADTGIPLPAAVPAGSAVWMATLD
jgi:hypothetical protein